MKPSASLQSDPQQSRLNRLVARTSRLVAAIEDVLLMLILSGMILLAGGQILLRNVWDSGLAWGDPLLRVAVLWLGLLGAMVATRDQNHIRIDILSRFLPPRYQRVSRLLTDLFTAVVCAIIAYHAAHLVLLERQDGIYAFSRVPAWLCELIIPFGFGVMALRFLLSFVTGLRRSGRRFAVTSGERSGD